jgi:hypothetical protein
MVAETGKKTVFVLGAGASVPYGFPSGRELRNNIIRRFRQDINELATKKDSASAQAYHDFLDGVAKFIKHFEKSRTNIDLFLTRRAGDYDELGKVAIFNEILKAERGCNFRAIKADVDWYYWFFNNYTEGLLNVDEIEGLLTWNYSFINFNYDRSLEKYLQSAVMANWGRTKEAQTKVDNLIRKIPIRHVYGSLGRLPWQKSEGRRVDWGGKYLYDNLALFSDNIGIMHNSRGQEISEELKRELEEADRVFLLGFAFAPENLKQLGIPKVFEGRKVAIYATALGYTEKERQMLSRRLVPDKSEDNQPKIVNTDCLSLLREYLVDAGGND